MRWLVLKDLRILRRSPLLVGLLVVYPIVIGVLIGFALSRGPDKPAVAFYSAVPESAQTLSVGNERVDTSRYEDRLFDAIDPIVVSSRSEAIEKVRSGEALGALVIPRDFTEKLQLGIEPAEVEVFYNAEDPLKREFAQNTINAQLHEANTAVSAQLTEVAVDYLRLLVSGGDVAFLGREFQVLGLEAAERIVTDAQRDLPRGSPARAQLEEVRGFARLARQNLDFSDDVLRAVGEPIRAKQHVLKGGHTPLTSYASAVAVTLSLMFVAVLLAAGMLALEREENAFLRLVRALVSRVGLLAAKALVAAGAAAPVALVMLLGMSLFLDLDAGRFPLWAVAAAAGALAFAALGLAIGALARDVRAASLLAFVLALPIAFLSLVPPGAVSGALYDTMRAVAAVFPFKPTLDAMQAALEDAGDLAAPLAHLAALFVAYGAAARLALRRFA